MSKKIRKIKMGILMVLVLFTSCFNENITAYAKNYYTYNDHKMIGGVGQYGNYRRYYYILNSASSHKGKIETAINDWVYNSITTSLSFRETSNRENSVMDIMKVENGGSSGVLAWTEFYKSGSSVSPSNQDWKYTYIKLYKPNFKSENCNIKGTIAHEMGHCFGLAHNNSKPDSIMCQTAYGRSVNKAQKCDLKGINHLYN